MSSIDKAIKYMETGERDDDGPQRIYDALDTLETHNINFYCRFWEALLEFKTPKIQRSTYAPETNKGEEDITITVVDGRTGNTDI